MHKPFLPSPYWRSPGSRYTRLRVAQRRTVNITLTNRHTTCPARSQRSQTPRAARQYFSRTRVCRPAGTRAARGAGRARCGCRACRTVASSGNIADDTRRRLRAVAQTVGALSTQIAGCHSRSAGRLTRSRTRVAGATRTRPAVCARAGGIVRAGGAKVSRGAVARASGCRLRGSRSKFSRGAERARRCR